MIEYKIFPAIGMARVGNAPAKFYIGPEQYRGLPSNPDGRPFTEHDFRDENGKLCRQAALFHIYQIENGVETEITLDSSDIKSIVWHAHLANKKPSWYQFQVSLGEDGYASNHPLRNPTVTGSERSKLIIDAGPRQIHGKNVGPIGFNRDNIPATYQGGHFPDGPLQPMNDSIDTLGELRTDAHGRLLVLGGLGISGTTDADASIPLGSYANNDNWWDDTSDGPIGATITFNDGSVVQAAPATVLVGPPKYAPEIANLVSLYDTIFDASVRSGNFPAIFANGFWKAGKDGYKPSFVTEIKPLLERAILYPWVAAIPPKPHKFDFAMLGKLNSTHDQGDPAFKGLRSYILDFLRPPGSENVIINSPDADNSGSPLLGGVGATMMPFLAGDNALIPGHFPSKYLRITDTQYFFLQQWVAGWFTHAPAPTKTPGSNLSRNVLENLVGGAFSPGIEMSWISRNPAIYAEPLRIHSHFVEHGPLQLDFNPARGMEAGDLTRYMAIPWQADFNECSSQPTDGRVLWWWPAQRPEYVYLEPEPEPVRTAAGVPPPPGPKTGKQVPWLGTDFDQQASTYIQFDDDVDMVRYWAGLGFVLEKDIQGERRFVEVARTLPRPFIPGE